MFVLTALAALSLGSTCTPGPCQDLDPGWQTKTFKQVRLTPQRPVCTIQVRWHGLDTISPGEGAKNDAAIVVLKGRKVLSRTTFRGSVSQQEAEIVNRNGYALLAVDTVYTGAGAEEILYRFDPETFKPVVLCHGVDLDLSPLPDGYVVEISDAAHLRIKDASQPEDRFGRRLTIETNPWRLTPGKWADEPAEGPKVARLSGKRNGHSYRVRFEEELPPPDKFKIAHGEVKFEGRSLWNYGYYEDEQTPHQVRRELRQLGVVIKSFDVSLDGRRILIPRRLYRDLWWPHLDDVSARLTKTGNLSLKLEGADGMGSWTATWTIRTNGQVTRKMDGPP